MACDLRVAFQSYLGIELVLQLPIFSVDVSNKWEEDGISDIRNNTFNMEEVPEYVRSSGYKTNIIGYINGYNIDGTNMIQAESPGNRNDIINDHNFINKSLFSL